MIAVFVDNLTKMTHMVFCTKEVIGSQYARLCMDNIFQLHGIPEVITSDRDPGFVSKFWEELFSKLGTDLRFSIPFHPITDGQSEVTIRIFENFLQPYIEHRPSTWVDKLPLGEFAVNNAATVNTGYLPFYLN